MPPEWSGPPRRAIVTGASRGIGRAAALRLARDGADVALLQRSGAGDLVEEITALGRRAHAIAVDLSQPQAAEAAVDEAAARLGGLDALVANAGAIDRAPALEVSLEEFRKVVETDLTSPFAAARAAARHMLAGDGGGIVLVASLLSFQGGLGVASYAAAKAGAANLARALANEWAALGVRVNAVAPGYVATELTASLRADPVRGPAIDARIPAGRWAGADDLAGPVAFLLSPDARYVHGHVLVVDGGWMGR